MSTIKLLAKMLVEDIKSKQGFFTHRSRLAAVKQIELMLLKDPSDDEIINLVEATRQHLYLHGFFGIRGRKGSTFLNLSQTFILQAKALKTRLGSENDLKTAIQFLAKMTLQKIEMQQNPRTTDQSQLDAHRAFSMIVNDEKISVTTILRSATEQKNAVTNHSRFSFWRQRGSHFLQSMNQFLTQATRLIKHWQKENLTVTQAYLQKKLKEEEFISTHASLKKEANNLHKQHLEMDKELEELDKKISTLLDKYSGEKTLSTNFQAWREHLIKGTFPLISETLLQNLTPYLNQANLQSMLQNYQKIINNPGYQRFKLPLLIDKKIDDLETEIDFLLEQYYSTSSPISRRWKSLRDKLITGEIPLTNQTFFNDFQLLIKRYPDLAQKIEDFKENINKKTYQDYKKAADEEALHEDAKEKFYYQFNKSIMDEHNTGPVRSTKFFDERLGIQGKPFYMLFEEENRNVPQPSKQRR